MSILKKILDLDRIEQKFWVSDILIPKGLLLIAAEPKVGKSAVALDLALSVASGKKFLNKYEVCGVGPVVYYNAEDQEGITRNRAISLCKYKGIDPTEADIHVIPPSQGIRIDTTEGIQQLRDALSDLNPRLLILDCFVRLHQIDENNSRQVALVLQSLKNLRSEFGTAICLVHHNKKSGSSTRSANRIRGSSEMFAFFDSAICLTKKPNGEICLDVEHKAAASLQGVPVSIKSIENEIVVEVRSTDTPHVTVTPPSIDEIILSKINSRFRAINLDQLIRLTGLGDQDVRSTIYRLLKSKAIKFTSEGYLRGDSQ